MTWRGVPAAWAAREGVLRRSVDDGVGRGWQARDPKVRGPAQQPALAERYAKLAAGQQLLGRLQALGQHGRADAVDELDDHRDQRAPDDVAVEAGDDNLLAGIGQALGGPLIAADAFGIDDAADVVEGFVEIVVDDDVVELVEVRHLLARGGQPALAAALKRLGPVSRGALLMTLVLLFGFQGEQIMAQPLVILLLAVPILIQVYFNAGLAYWLNRRLGTEFCVAGPSALIGASNFFELAVATAISLFGLESGAALATVVGAGGDQAEERVPADLDADQEGLRVRRRPRLRQMRPSRIQLARHRRWRARRAGAAAVRFLLSDGGRRGPRVVGASGRRGDRRRLRARGPRRPPSDAQPAGFLAPAARLRSRRGSLPARRGRSCRRARPKGRE